LSFFGRQKSYFCLSFTTARKKPLKQKQKKIADDIVMEDAMATFDE